jgi:hypothetical protein
VGYTDPGYNVTLSDGNYQNINNQGSYNFPSSQLTGTYNPLDGNVAFQTYNGLSPNGHWVLTIDNELGGTSFTLNSWSLTLDTVPEPVNVALGVFGLLFATILMVSRRADSPLMKKQPA